MELGQIYAMKKARPFGLAFSRETAFESVSDHLKSDGNVDLFVQFHSCFVRTQLFDAVIRNGYVLSFDADAARLNGFCNLNRIDRTEDFSAFACFRTDFDGERFEFGLELLRLFSSLVWSFCASSRAFTALCDCCLMTSATTFFAEGVAATAIP